jgi:DNA-binding GntR family transcriptional regulator
VATTKQPAAQRAYSATKELILSGELPGGALVSEGQIADQLEISRTPVREAFLRLSGEHLLQLIPKRGAIVVPVSPGEALDVLDCRQALESAAVLRLVTFGERLGPALQTAREALARQDQCAVDRDVVAFAAADEQFHRALVTASGNRLADDFYATLADRQRRMTIGSVGLDSDRLPALIAEHGQLLDLIVAGDAAGFTQMLRAHLTTTHARTLRP